MLKVFCPFQSVNELVRLARENKKVTADEEKLNVKIVIRKQNLRGEEILEIKTEKVESEIKSQNVP